MTKTKLLDEHLRNFDPSKYASTRNFETGTVSKLSPYISRYAISLQDVYLYIKNKGYTFEQAEKFYQELAWREFWQMYANRYGIALLKDFRTNQHDMQQTGTPQAIVEACTGIKSIDKSINELYQTGYMHNHWRMYVASTVCNIGHYHWYDAARWMYYHLYDADWASNFLSWQWVAGTFNLKIYYANQENINKYSAQTQHGTFLDCSYDELAQAPTPEVLRRAVNQNLATKLPETKPPHIRKDLPTLIYNFYNLPLNWHTDWDANRILLLEPAHFDAFPVSTKVLDFALELAKNITDIQLYTGSFESLKELTLDSKIYFVKHALFNHYQGEAEERIGLFKNTNFYLSFFNFWNEHKTQLSDK